MPKAVKDAGTGDKGAELGPGAAAGRVGTSTLSKLTGEPKSSTAEMVSARAPAACHYTGAGIQIKRNLSGIFPELPWKFHATHVHRQLLWKPAFDATVSSPKDAREEPCEGVLRMVKERELRQGVVRLTDAYPMISRLFAPLWLRTLCDKWREFSASRRGQHLLCRFDCGARHSTCG